MQRAPLALVINMRITKSKVAGCSLNSSGSRQETDLFNISPSVNKYFVMKPKTENLKAKAKTDIFQKSKPN